MDLAYLSALAGLTGSAIGGATSFFASWLGQSNQLRAQLLLNDKGNRQQVYREFIDEASSLYIDALTRDTPDLSKMIKLYALVSRMRILSSPEVIEEADQVARLIVESYPQPAKTFDDIRIMVNEHTLDPLYKFSEACRQELRKLTSL